MGCTELEKERAMKRISGLLAGAVVLLVIGHLAHGQTDTSVDGTLEQFLKNGEYSAAFQLAEKSRDARERNRLLTQIANSQIKQGLAAQSVSTVKRIDDGDLRQSILKQAMDGGAGCAFKKGKAGAAGGGVVADFDPLIELIQNTIDPQSWQETNGGPGTIEEFRSGVSVDAGGLLRKVEYSKGNGLLEDIRRDAKRRSVNSDLFRDSGLRKVSLNRLEKECQLLAAEGREPTEAMKRLAGIYEIRYLLVYPETGDIVIAGPAGDWKNDVEGTSVNVKTGKPLFRLEDLVVCLRNAIEHDGKFGCSIDPRQANLKAFQDYLISSPLRNRSKKEIQRWRDGLQAAMGFQDISIDGIDPQSVVARVIVEADYRMKLVGMDLEKGVPGVESFLSRVQLDKNGNLPPLDIMRLEFVLDYDNITVTEDGNGFQLHGRGVKVLSEKELLNQKGERVHTGKSEGPAAEFASSFTRHFNKMAARYPIYAQMKNVFDLAMVTNLIRAKGLDARCGWKIGHFGREKQASLVYSLRKSNTPRQVKSVMNYRQIDVKRNGRVVKTQFVVGVSGGVTVDARKLIDSPDLIQKDTYGKLKLDRKTARPQGENWWWD